MTYTNDCNDECDKKILCSSMGLNDLEDYAERYVERSNTDSSNNKKQWRLCGLPTMGDRKLIKDYKKILIVSDKVFLLISSI